MKDVAQKAGVHTTTVSLVLRNSARIPLATRRRIQAIAKEMGYQQDPMLSALVSYRNQRLAPKAPPTVAMIFDFKDQPELEREPVAYRKFLEGATRKAEELGYRVEPFFFSGRVRAAEGRRIGRILFSRGITGVILCAFRSETESFEIEWDKFSIVQIECEHLKLPLHMVSADQMMMAREAVRRLWTHGYRRIGIAVGRAEETYLDHAFTVGFHGEAALHPGLELAPPLLLTNGITTEECAALLREWIQRFSIEAVLSNWGSIPHALDLIAGDIPGSTVSVELELEAKPHRGSFGGTMPRDVVVGERAMEQLAMLLRLNHTGLVETPHRILIPATWMEGDRSGAIRARSHS
ncbi:MAG: LacI family DNA-binding transcriptional regulator [Lacunisphaera sp.]